MAFRDLHEFIAALESEGELLRVREEVSAELEITEFTDIMSKSPGGGKALLFEKVAGSRFPVLTNAFGSERRMCLALGCAEMDEIGRRLTALMNTRPPRTFLQKARMLPELLELSKAFPKVRGGRAPCQEVVLKGDDVDLGIMPVLKCWPQDGGRFVTLPVVFTKDREGRRNVGMYRMQIFDRSTTGMHWHIHKDGRQNYSEFQREGRRMEVAVAVGTDPAVTYAATAPMPHGMDEMLLAGFIRRSPVQLVRCRTVDLEVPATTEFVLEGYVEPNETRTEGPFGDHTGYYSLKGEYPVFHVTALTHRLDAVYSATVVGRPPMEDCYMAKATERIFLPPFRMIVPEVVDYWMPWEGVFHNIVVAAISKSYPAQARKVMSSFWGSGQMSFAKMVVLIDEAALLRSGDLMRRLLDTIDPWSDLVLAEGILDVLDHSAPSALHGGKLGVDATARTEGEPARGPGRFRPTLNGQELCQALRGSDSGFCSCRIAVTGVRNPLILASVRKDGSASERFAKAILEDGQLSAQGIYVLYDEIDLADDSLVLWKAFNNIDPVRDIRRTATGMVLDATKKNRADGFDREWPDEIVMSEDIKRRVQEKAVRMGIAPR